MVTDQMRTAFTPTVPGRWEGVSPSPAGNGRRGGDAPAADVATVEIGAGQLRSGSWTDAARVRHLDQKLGRVARDAETLRFNLEQVKLYPPYPINESRRAETIRQFNGLATEVARLEGLTLQALAPNASTERAEQAVADLGALVDTIGSTRASLAAAAASPAESGAAAASRAAGSALAQVDAGLTASDAGFLRRFP